MNTILLFIIMKLGTISSLLFWGSALFLAYLLTGFFRVWWGTNVDAECWTPYWRPLRRKTAVAVAFLLISLILPTTKEATIMYVIPAIAQSSVWDRVFGHNTDQKKIEEVRHWIRDAVGK